MTPGRNDSEILQACFGSADGEKALEVLRRLSGYDRICCLKAGEREQCHALGRASLFDDILKSITPKKEKNGRKHTSLSDEL
nr:MAG TPA: SAMP Motif [Caudoviricetes sp.]